MNVLFQMLIGLERRCQCVCVCVWEFQEIRACVGGVGGAAWLVSGPLTTFSLFHREHFHRRLLPEPFTAETQKLPETGSGPSRSCLAQRVAGGGGLPDQAVQSFGHKLELIYIFSDGTKYRNLFSLLLRREKGGKVSPSVTSSPLLVISPRRPVLVANKCSCTKNR